MNINLHEETLKIARNLIKKDPSLTDWVVSKFPELEESEDERIRREIVDYLSTVDDKELIPCESWIAWLEKQCSEPNWCHHKVDLSDCSEEYRKAYYDGWNKCNMKHSQCKSESNDVVKCLINGMKFYYEDNKNATWGTEKFSMKVKDILSWLEKQGEQINTDNLTPQEAMDIAVAKCFNEQKPVEWSEEDDTTADNLAWAIANDKIRPQDRDDYCDWLKSLKDRYTWKPSDAQMASITCAVRKMKESACYDSELVSLLNDLKKLKSDYFE